MTTFKRTAYYFYKLLFLSGAFFIFINCNNKQKASTLENTYPLIPSAQHIDYGKKELHFKSVNLISNTFSNEGDVLSNFFSSNQIETHPDGLTIELQKTVASSSGSMEAYQLSISDKVVISAHTAKGVFYGIQSLKQLFRKRQTGVFPEVSIRDWPAFKIRGFMHDTGRNFQSVAQLKEQIEILAQYKFNVFHWHLTDNPGWRLESKLYPELQSTIATTRQKGSFYSQKDFKEILAFCKERNITVIPELDIPGHTESFRKALNIKTMRDSKVAPILLDLFRELLNLAAANEMPYIHIGTDEVKTEVEGISKDVLLEIMNLIKDNNREVIVWKQGIQVKEDSTSINQLWAQHERRKGHRFIDSRANYINHLDPFAGMARLYFQQPCRQPKGDTLALGGILCAWPDNNIGDERDILTQNPIYPSIVFYADAIWKGRAKNYPEYWAKLPPKESEELKELKDFQKFEKKVIAHRDLYFKEKEFQYVVQTDKNWKLIGPFNHGGNFNKSFPVENGLKEKYMVDGTTFHWTDSHIGATIHLKRFFGFEGVTKAKKGTYYAYTSIFSPEAKIQDFWIGFQGWSRSSRRGGPTPNIGQWHFTNPKIWVNDKEIAPPHWQQPNLKEKTSEIPFIDEDYFYRVPSKIQLKKGWNKVLLKIPHGKKSWKWMFTCTPINSTKNGVQEVTNLKFSTKFKNNKL